VADALGGDKRRDRVRVVCELELLQADFDP